MYVFRSQGRLKDFFSFRMCKTVYRKLPSSYPTLQCSRLTKLLLMLAKLSANMSFISRTTKGMLARINKNFVSLLHWNSWRTGRELAVHCFVYLNNSIGQPTLTLCEAILQFRSITTWAHSNLIFGSYGYRSVAIFRVHAAERQAMLLTLWKDLRSVEKVVVLALWSCASLHPRALQCSCTQFLLWCLVCWAGSERFTSARFQLRSRRQRGLEVYLSIWQNSAFMGKLGSLSVTWRTWDATQEATHFAVLAPCTHSSWWLLFETIFGNFSQCHERLDLFFEISETKAFRQGEVVISKCASFW